MKKIVLLALLGVVAGVSLQARADTSDQNVYTALDLEASGAIRHDQLYDVLGSLDAAATPPSSTQTDSSSSDGDQ